jgi:hypothetical protein
MVLLRIMSNGATLDNTIVRRGIDALGDRLPARWRLSAKRPGRPLLGYQPDALLEIRAPDGGRAVLIVEAKPRLPAQVAATLAPRLAAAATEAQAAGALVIAPFLSALTRDRLGRARVSYLDLTGNVRIALDRPALLIEAEGADEDPSPPRRGIRSLKGRKAARIVRALCDWRPPVGVRELARRAGADPGYTTRVLSLLEQEDVVRRGARGAVIDVRWRDLLERWAHDYQVTTSNRTLASLAPRGLDAFTSRLPTYKGRWALTGALAVPRAVSIAPARVASCYVENPERAVGELDLRPAETGANVLLLEPFDQVVWERTRDEAGLTRVALSQCCVDLLTGTGREPAEAEFLLSWMAENEHAWRA